MAENNDPDATVHSHRADGAPPEAGMTSVLAANPDAAVPFVFGAEIARGGMGSILKAEDCKLGRAIAVKIMLSELNLEESQQQRFINEAAVLARLEHPNIVPIHDLGRTTGGDLYYTMKLVKGRTLKDILDAIRDGDAETTEQYTLDRLLTIFRKVCDAMAFAHANGIIHRDLKPENVMVGEFGEVLVMDWGLAKFLHRSAPTSALSMRLTPAQQAAVDASGTNFGMTMEGDVMGTPQYMSPEQAEGRIADMDARSDIFSLGGILYTLLTLRPPVTGRGFNEILRNVATGNITSPTVFGTSAGRSLLKQKGSRPQDPDPGTPLPHMPGGRVPAALCAVVMKALTVDRGKRYQDVPELTADIEAHQGGFATTAERAGVLKQFALLVKRHKAASLGLAAVLVIGSTLGTKAFMEGRRAEQMLGELRGTAPTFAEQARALVAGGKFEEALQKMNYAVKLAPEEVEHHVQRGHILQSLLRLTEAEGAYQEALKRDPAHRVAAESAELSRRLAPQLSGGELPRAGYEELFRAMKAQGRTDEATIIAGHFGGQTKELLEKWKPILTAALKGHPFTLSADEGATLKLLLDGNHSGPTLTDISALKGMPVRTFEIYRCAQITDLTPLTGAPMVEVDLSESGINDLTPLKGARLRKLKADNKNLSTLAPLVGAPLESLEIGNSRVRDLSPVKGAPLRHLDIDRTLVSDLSPLVGAPLEQLYAQNTSITDLTPLAGMPLVWLDLYGSKIGNLAPLRGLPLKHLKLENTAVSDLTPLAGLPLETLILAGCQNIADLTPLAEIKTLVSLTLPTRFRGQVDFLRRLPRLQFIDWARNNSALTASPVKRSAADFWKQEDGNKKALGPALPAMIEAGIHPDVLTGWEGEAWELDLSRWPTFTDLSIFHGAPLTKVNLGRTKIADLSPLKGMPLRELSLYATSVTDLSPLVGLPLKTLNITGTAISDLTPLAGMKLETFIAENGNPNLADISALRGMPLRELLIQGASVTDLSPLANCTTLEFIALPSSQKAKLDLTPLRRLPKLERMVWGGFAIPRGNAQPAAEFWKQYDAWKAAGGK